ncbi:MAG: YdcF family protein [Bacteroidales bacterium]|nr:YdcF family protein [Bacteroidales bacterium]
MKGKKIIQYFIHLSKKLMILSGVLFLFAIIYAFTSGPFWNYYYLGIKHIEFTDSVDYIIFLGGAGMPSESNLIRIYYASQLAGKHPGAKIIVALPGDTADDESSVQKVLKEFELRKIDKKRIILEPNGVNTRSQALNAEKLINGPKSEMQLVVVTSPEYIRRSMLCFKKLGFEKTGGYPAFEHALESELSYKNKELGGNEFIPVVGKTFQFGTVSGCIYSMRLK